ncbi:MAG: hypothetical protein DMG01_05320 [Acidobacteria bacterium]|nr:MAG: hypothetical protein DMG01_05320 [Acidobacteriota bacterium]
MAFRSSLAIAVRALGRNRLQTSLTIVGMTIGVAAVLAMIAIGTGAEAAIGDQIRAAGMNLIVVTAGNYKVKSTDDFGGGAVEPSAALGLPDPLWRRALSLVEPTLVAHPEDDPMEKHDHPTARQRLGDSEAGLGSAATLTSADADAIRRIRGVQYVAEGLHQNVHVAADAKRWFTRLHGTDLQLPLIRRAWTFPNGRFFSAGEQSRAEQVVVLGAVAAERLFGGENPPRRRRRHDGELGGRARARRRSVRCGVRAVHDDSPPSESHEAERHHDHGGLDRRGVSDHERRDDAAARAPPHHRREARRLHRDDAGAPGAREGRAAARRRARRRR